MSASRRFITSDMSDEQIVEMMDSVESDEESVVDYDSDESVPDRSDPDFVPSDVQLVIDGALEEMQLADQHQPHRRRQPHHFDHHQRHQPHHCHPQPHPECHLFRLLVKKPTIYLLKLDMMALIIGR